MFGFRNQFGLQPLELESPLAHSNLQELALPTAFGRSPEKRSSNGTSRIRRVSETRTPRFRLRVSKPRRSRPSIPVNGSYFATSQKTFEISDSASWRQPRVCTQNSKVLPGLLRLNLKLKQAGIPLLHCVYLALCVLASRKNFGATARPESTKLRLAAIGWLHWFACPAVMTVVRLPDDKSHGSPHLL